MKNKKTLKPVFAAWKRKKIEYKEVFLGDLNNETKKMDEGKNDFPIR